MKIQLIDKSHTGRRSQLPLFATSITIHGTANPYSTAQNEADNVCYNEPYRQVSFHFVVDDTRQIQVLPTNEVAWHAGVFDGNMTSLSIEICESGDRLKTLRNALDLTYTLMQETGINVIKKHYDWSRKNCPRILIDSRHVKDGLDWNWFAAELEKMKMTKEEAKLIVKTKAGLSDATIQYLADDYRYGDELITKLANAMEDK